jgi:hypothetical protein
MIVLYERNLKVVRPLTHGNEEYHKKYDAFDRIDKWWFTQRWYMYFFLWTFLIRFILGFGSMLIMAILSVILSIG